MLTYVRGIFVFWIFRIVVAVLVAYYCFSTEKALFNFEEVDGFTYQMVYIRTVIDARVPFWSLEPLLMIHWLRYYVTLPIDIFDQSSLRFFSPVIGLSLVFPLFFLFKTVPGRVLSISLLLVLFFMSYRNMLVICGIGYLFLYCQYNRNFILLLISALLVNLSSGSVLVAIVCAVFLLLHYRIKSIAFVVYLIFLFLSLVISLQDKYIGFALGEAGYAATEFNASGVYAVITRSTIYVSLVTGNFLRAGLYLAIGAIAVVVVIVASASPRYRGYAVLFVASLPVFLVEGLGVVALIVPVLLFLSGAPLPLGSTPSVRRPVAMRPVSAR
jgi:hypothetical protein